MRTDNRPVAVLGAGGHAKVVLSTLHAAKRQVFGLFDDDPSTHGRQLLGQTVLGPIDQLEPHADIAAVLAIGSNRARQSIARRVDCDWTAVVHPASWVDPSAEIEPGAVIFAGAVIQPDTTVGAHAIINTGASADHDCVLGEFVHLAPGVRLAGAVRIDEGAFVGVGAAVLPERTVGSWAVVGGGALVAEDVGEEATVTGVPAKPAPRPISAPRESESS